MLLIEYGDVKRAFYGVEPGRWVCSRHPRGLAREHDGIEGKEEL